jgi:signal transduction histidine kinase
MFPTKLKTQLLLITILPLLLTISVVSLFILFDVLENIESAVVKRSQSIASQASVMSEFPLYTGDVDALNKVADLMIRTHELSFIRFIDSTGQLLLEKSGNEAKGKVREFQFPVYSHGPNLDDFSDAGGSNISKVPLGSIEIGFTNNSAETQRFDAYTKVLGISLLALALGILLVYLFSRRLSNAINALMTTAKKLEQKNFAARVKENGSGELLNFQRTFNSMIDSLERNDAELQDKVNAATASLSYTVEALSEKNKALAQQRQETIDLERSKAILEERERIMRDMHDGIGGQLVASLAILELEKDSEVNRNIHAVLTECLNDLRLIIHSLSLQNSVMGSLLADFKYRTSKKLEQLDIELNWQVDAQADELGIKPQTGLHLLRILQEAFTNILKHAGASQIDFNAYREGQDFIISIEDDGTFNPQSEAIDRGYGINSMKSRAGKIGGRLELEKNTSGGCRVTLVLPESFSSTARMGGDRFQVSKVS